MSTEITKNTEKCAHFLAKRSITENFLCLLCRLKAPTFGFRGLCSYNLSPLTVNKLLFMR
ncbi:hypothetical protein CRENPOLYSF2_1450011 [Crenothrix polyspora]|uniref:Uncharacterized protein n=1 Tax=Crenothrix polyspora TaxID=360316 RepID=A0A1R4H1F5_9GAMM|nr:hypothetical protein CRENPOLYSF2_1450011 [Crenothrix polyspora]